MKKGKDKSNNPRYVAFMVLKEKSSFYEKRLSSILDSTSLSSLDKGLVTNLVKGVDRERLFLDWTIEKAAKRPLIKIDGEALKLLRLGAFQILRTRIPSYAAISETVDVSKIFVKRHIVSFINAVLREIDRKKEKFLAGPSEDDLLKYFSIFYSHPEWMINRWMERWGREDLKKLCEFNNNPPPVTVRHNPLKITLEELKKYFSKNSIEFTPLSFLKDGFEILSGSKLEDLEGYKKGYFTLQGESSMFAANILKPKAGERILDLCAAPGNKTTHMAELMGNKGEILAVDISEKRLEFLPYSLKRLGIRNVKTSVCDILEMEDNFSDSFDRVLIDAPCSGTGVLSRRPDLRWNKKKRDVKRLSLLQKKLLQKASSFVKPGGYLAYSVCSLEPEEGEEVVKDFLNNNKEFTPDLSGIENLIPISEKNSSGLLLLPHIHNVEGFFITLLKKC